MIKDLTAEEAGRWMDAAPPAVQEVAASPATDETVLRIGHTHNLHIDVIGLLADLTRYMLIGYATPPQALEELRAAGVADQEARQILNEVNEAIFMPLHERIRQGGGSRPAAPAARQAPPAPVPPGPPPPPRYGAQMPLPPRPAPREGQTFTNAPRHHWTEEVPARQSSPPPQMRQPSAPPSPRVAPPPPTAWQPPPQSPALPRWEMPQPVAPVAQEHAAPPLPPRQVMPHASPSVPQGAARASTPPAPSNLPTGQAAGPVFHEFPPLAKPPASQLPPLSSEANPPAPHTRYSADPYREPPE